MNARAQLHEALQRGCVPRGSTIGAAGLRALQRLARTATLSFMAIPAARRRLFRRASPGPSGPVVSKQVEFLAFAAHELRGPLGSIRMAAAILGRGGPEALCRAQALIIERQAAHMSRMLEDLLDQSRASTGKLRLELDTIDIADVVDRAVDMCRSAMTKRRQRLEIRGLDSPCPLEADAVRLTQILSNLLDNASKYSPDGQSICLTVRPLESSVELMVTDRGIGMAASTLESIFEPFAQNVHAIGFDGSGLGLGLSVVRELVALHGGHVVASSDGIGQGSRFIVTLPRAAVTAGRDQPVRQRAIFEIFAPSMLKSAINPPLVRTKPMMGS